MLRRGSVRYQVWGSSAEVRSTVVRDAGEHCQHVEHPAVLLPTPRWIAGICGSNKHSGG
jgi:hypothetical protein